MAGELNPLTQPPVTEKGAIFDYVKMSLGYPIIEIEIRPEQFDVFLKYSLEQYSRPIPMIRWFSTPAFAGIQEYALPRDTLGYGLVEVLIPRLDPIAPLLLSSGPRLDILDTDTRIRTETSTNCSSITSISKKHQESFLRSLIGNS